MPLEEGSPVIIDFDENQLEGRITAMPSEDDPHFYVELPSGEVWAFLDLFEILPDVKNEDAKK